MAIERGKVTVYESRISEAFILKTGTVRQNMQRIAVINLTFAQKFAPKRTHTMEKSMYYTITPSGKYELRYTVSTHEVLAPYAIYTLRGTTGIGGWIYPNSGAFMWVRPKPRSYYIRYTPRMKVRTQVGKNWLGFSMQATLQATGVA